MTEDWTVVGASGKPRRGTTVKGNSQETRKDGPVQTSHPADSTSQMPGWGTDSAAPVAGHANLPPCQSRNRSRRRTAMQAPRTLAEQVEALHRLIEQCKEEVRRSRFYTNLKEAFTATASHTLTTDGHPRHPPANPASAPLPREATSMQPAVHNQDMSSKVPPPRPAHKDQRCQPGVSSGGHHEHQGLPPCEAEPSSSGEHWSTQVKQLVVLGLGSVEDSRNSRYQLALALLLTSELLPGCSMPTETYDPVFSEVDRALLQGLGWTVMEQDTQCSRRAEVPTFFFLPHLEGHLCDRLLAANLPSGHGGTFQTCPLGHCILLANSFRSYQERWDVWGSGPQPRKVSTATHVAGRPERPDLLLSLLAAGAVWEVPTPQESTFPAQSAFNDTSLHVFKQAAVHVAAAAGGHADTVYT